MGSEISSLAKRTHRKNRTMASSRSSSMWAFAVSVALLIGAGPFPVHAQSLRGTAGNSTEDDGALLAGWANSTGLEVNATVLEACLPVGAICVLNAQCCSGNCVTDINCIEPM